MCYVPASDPSYLRHREYRIALAWTVGIILPLAFWLLGDRSGRLYSLADEIEYAGGPTWALWLTPWACALAGVLVSPQMWFRMSAGPALWLVTLLSQCAACSAATQRGDTPLGMQLHAGLMLDVCMAMLVLLAGLSPLGRLDQPQLPQDDGGVTATGDAREHASWGTLEMDERQLLLGL
jgi:hypothetical protein